MPHQIGPTVSKENLIGANFSEGDITSLISLKCLLLQGHDAFQLTVPSGGATVSSIANGRKALIKYVSRRPLKMAERFEVERRTIDESIFYAEFHVQELLGIGVFELIQSHGRPDQLHLIYDPFSEGK
jgi:hypothetical protein